MACRLLRTAQGNPFNFKIKVKSGGETQGQLRYHPFVNDQETYPVEARCD